MYLRRDQYPRTLRTRNNYDLSKIRHGKSQKREKREECEEFEECEKREKGEKREKREKSENNIKDDARLTISETNQTSIRTRGRTRDPEPNQYNQCEVT